MTLISGDVIVGKDGERWKVDKIYGYLWHNRLYHKGYWLTRKSDQEQRYFTRKRLCQVFGGSYDTT